MWVLGIKFQRHRVRAGYRRRTARDAMVKRRARRSEAKDHLPSRTAMRFQRLFSRIDWSSRRVVQNSTMAELRREISTSII